MDLPVGHEQRAQVPKFQQKHRIGLLTLLFSDIVGSTKLKTQWGHREGVAQITLHHVTILKLRGGSKVGELISTGGDSCFIVFAKPSDSVKFALLLQAELQVEARKSGRPMFDRVGIHEGGVFIEEASGTKPKDLYGIQVDTCGARNVPGSGKSDSPNALRV